MTWCGVSCNSQALGQGKEEKEGAEAETEDEEDVEERVKAENNS